MRVLFLTCHLPYPAVSGGRRRENELLRRLAGVETHLVAVSKTVDEDRRNAVELSGVCASVSVFAAHPEAPASGGGTPAQVLRHRSPAAAARVAELVGGSHVDAVHVEGFYLLHLVPEPCPVPMLLVEQNVEFLLWEQRARVAGDEGERLEHLREAQRTRSAEVSAWRRADLCAAVTDEDAAAMRAAVPGLGVRLVPGGVPEPPLAGSGGRTGRSAPLEDPAVVFVGNFAYQPNVDAALQLGREIWPLVLRRVPRARLYLVGNAPPPELGVLASSAAGVTVTGPVPAVEPFLEAADVVALPLRVGGGVKVKMLEALAAGRAVVTTSTGAQGLGVVGHAFVVADDPARFAEEVTGLLEDRARRGRLEASARHAARALPTWDAAAAALRECYEELRPGAAVMGQRRRAGPAAQPASSSPSGGTPSASAR